MIEVSKGQKFSSGIGTFIPLSLIHCNKCGEYRYLTLHAFWNISDFGAKCPKCNAINTITLKNGELKKHV
jgi:phage FluMu protein Com